MTNFEKYRTELKKLGCGIDFMVDFRFNISECGYCDACIFHGDGKDCDCEKLNWLYADPNDPKITQKEKVLLEILRSNYIKVAKSNNNLLFYEDDESPCITIPLRILSVTFSTLEEGKKYFIDSLVEE